MEVKCTIFKRGKKSSIILEEEMSRLDETIFTLLQEHTDLHSLICYMLKQYVNKNLGRNSYRLTTIVFFPP